MKKRISRIFSLILTLALVSALLPTAVFAADSTVSNWTQLVNAVSAAPTDGTVVTIRLEDDITAEAQLRIEPGRKITLDLNGKTLNLNGFDIFAATNVTFTIKDGAGSGMIAGGSAADCGGCISSVSDGLPSYVILESGTIQNCTVTSSSYGGGAVYLNKNTHFIMNGGTIKNCSSANMGGAIYINKNCSFTMNGGTITDCQATVNGGAVYAAATGSVVNLHGGTIDGCTSTEIGAGVYVNGGSFLMDGGTITNCTSNSNGGGVYVNTNGTFTMKGGSIENCLSKLYGGGVYVNTSGTFTMDDGTIDGCKAIGAAGVGAGGSGSAGGAFTMNGGIIENCIAAESGANQQGGGIGVSGGAVLTITGGLIRNNRANKHGGGAYIYQSTVTISGGEFYNNTGNPGSGIYQNQCAAANVSCTGGRFDVNNTYFGILPTDSYTITLNRNGGSGGSESITQAWNTDLQSITLPSREDCVFWGYFNEAGDQYYDAEGNGVRKWDYIGDQTLYAHWQQHGVRELTAITDLEETEEIDNAVGFDVFSTANVGEGDGYADITYYFTIEWEVSGESIQLYENGIYVWNPETMQYEKDEEQKDFSLGESTSLDMTVTVTNRSNAEAKYAVSYADSNDDLTTVESQKDDSENNASGTLASADRNGAAAAAPNSGYAYSISPESIDDDGNEVSSIVYSGTVTVTALADEAVFADQDNLTLGVYTVTICSASKTGN